MNTTTKYFKECSCCGAKWATRKEFKLATKFVGVWKELGVVLFNCECKTTLSIELYKGSIEHAQQERMRKKLSKGDINVTKQKIARLIDDDSNGIIMDNRSKVTGYCDTTKTGKTD